MLERGLGTSSWTEKHVDVCPIELSELTVRGEPVAREGNLSAWAVSIGFQVQAGGFPGNQPRRKLLESIRRGKHWPKDSNRASGQPNFTDSVVCF
jgi:hypothetical protein